MIVLPDFPTDKMAGAWAEAWRKQAVHNPADFLPAFRIAFKALTDSAPCPWTKIEGPDSEPPENQPVHVSFDGEVQDIFYCLRFCEKGDSREWLFLDMESGTLELFSDYNDSGKTPTHYMLPIKPEPPK